MTGATATVGDDRGGAFHDRLPVGVGHVGHEHVADNEIVHLIDRGQHLDRPGADLLPDCPPLGQDLGSALDHESLHRTRRAAGLHGLGPGLKDIELPVDAVLTPLDVHGTAVVLLDHERLPGQLLDLGVGEAQFLAVGRIDVHEFGGLADGTIFGVDHLRRLAADGALQDRRAFRSQGRLVDVKLVGVHRSLDDPLAEPVRGGDEHRLVEAGFGVHGEHDPCRPDVGADHLLHARRERDGLMLELVVHPVSDRAVVVQRREHLLDGRQHRLDATNVEKGFLLTRERRIGQILGRRAGAHRHRHLLIRARQLFVGATDLVFELGRERLVHHRFTDLLAGCDERLHVVGVEIGQGGVDGVVQALVGQEASIGISGGGEPVGHPDTERRQVGDHFTQRRVLTPDLFKIGETEIGEPLDVHRHCYSLRC